MEYENDDEMPEQTAELRELHAKALKNFDLLGMTFGPEGVRPPMTLLGVTRLAIAPLMFEIEAEAMA